MRVELLSEATGAKPGAVTWPAVDVTSSAVAMAKEVRDQTVTHADTRTVTRYQLVEALNEATNGLAHAADPVASLDAISNRGMAWRDVAATVGVSVPAVTKWRRGEGVSAPRRRGLYRLAALLDMLDDHGISDPVSWLETPLLDDVMIAPMALLRGGRVELVLALAAFARTPALIEEILTEFDPDWRTTYIDPDFEVVNGADGLASIQPRRR